MRLLLLLVLLCCSWPALAADTVVVVVRHAEKAADDPRDPNLSEAGRQRAKALAKALADAPLAAVYATGYRRTQQTAQPSAALHGVEVQTLAAGREADGDALRERIRKEHAGTTVLVVGHSNTVPAIVGALSGKAAAAMAEDEFDRLSIVVLRDEGEPRLLVARY
ncbi:MAG TPA: phosphoglycerate mutase family protein [Arenimonas sp.]|nr:phosphoglycerate mutase family protein [Arenimonas sp.]